MNYITDNSFENEKNIFYLNSILLCSNIARYIKKQTESDNILNIIVNSDDINSTIDLLNYANKITLTNTDDIKNNRFGGTSEGLYSYVMTKLIPYYNYLNPDDKLFTFDGFLTKFEYKISELFIDSFEIPETITTTNIYDQGYWEFVDTINDEINDYAVYYFQLQVSDISNFSNILLDIDSSISVDGWYLEEETNIFNSITLSGVDSSYIGRRIMFKSDISQYLTRGEDYYFRIRQKTNTTDYSYRTYNKIIYT